MRTLRTWRLFAAGLAGLAAAPAAADWAEFEMTADDPPRRVGAVEAVDSWFTTLATLVFEVEGLAPGTYPVALLEQADCAGAAAGRVYRRDSDPAEAPAGALGEFVVAADGAHTRTLTIKPPKLDAAAEKLTVTEMRGHALVLLAAAGAPPGVAACGAVPAAPPEEPDGAAGVD